MEQSFILISSIIITSSIMIIISINPIHSVFWLVLTFINSSGLLIFLGFDFIALMLVIIYIGAITIIFLFVIMMLDVIQINITQNINISTPLIIIITINSILYVYYLLDSNNLSYYFNSSNLVWDFEMYSHINTLGLLFYTDYYYSFILISILLLVAMIGAIVLTLELSIITKRQLLSQQHQRNNSWI